MNLNAMHGAHSPAPFSKTGERSAKAIAQDERGFSDALNEKTAKRTAKDGVENDEAGSRVSWKLDGYLSGLPELDTDTPPADEADAGEFGEVLDDLLSEGGEAVVIEASASGDTLTDDIVLDDAMPDATTNSQGKQADLQVETEEADTKDANTAPPTIVGLDGPAGGAAVAPQPDAAVQTLAASTSSALAGPARTISVERQGERPARSSNDGASQRQGNIAVERSTGDSRQPAASGTVQPDAVARPASASSSPETTRFTPVRDAIRSSNADTSAKSAPPSSDPLAGRVNVLGFTAALAPSPATTPLLSSTATGVFAAMESDPTWRAAALESNAGALQRGNSFSAGVNTLRIQLQPVELGMVTARLTATGSQLSVEIQVESNDARQKLANDSDAILKALRAVGYDVEKVTIQQAPQNTSGNPQQGSAGREHFMPNQQSQSDGGTNGQAGQQGGRTQDSERSAHGSSETPADNAGSALYI